MSLQRFLVQGGSNLRSQAALNKPASLPSHLQLRQAGWDKDQIDYFVDKLTEPKNRTVSAHQMQKELVADFLGYDSIDTCIVRREWTRFWQPMLCLGYTNVKDNYNVIDWPREHRYGRALAENFVPVFEDIEVGVDKKKTVPSAQTDFITTADGVKLYVNANLRGDMFNDPNIAVQTHRDHKEAAEAFLDRIDSWVRNANIYKDKLLSFNSGFLHFLAVPRCGWKDVILPKKIIHEVRRATVDMLKRRDKFYDLGLGVRRSVLLEGSPGVGKTQISRALSNEVYASTETQCSIIWVSTKSIDRPKDIKGLYSAARTLAPTLLILEDVDLIGAARGHDGPDYLLGELLTQMDGAEDNSGIITLATTNDLAKIDYALTKRPGRFDRLLSVPLPNRRARTAMLKRFAEEHKATLHESNEVEADSGAWAEIIAGTRGMTGAYLKELIKTAIIEAVNNDEINEDGKPVLAPGTLAAALDLVKESFGRSPRNLENQLKKRH